MANDLVIERAGGSGRLGELFKALKWQKTRRVSGSLTTNRLHFVSAPTPSKTPGFTNARQTRDQRCAARSRENNALRNTTDASERRASEFRAFSTFVVAIPGRTASPTTNEVGVMHFADTY